MRFLAVFFMLFFGIQSFVATASPVSLFVEKVVSFKPGKASAEYFKKAHTALVYDPTKIIEIDGITRYEQANPKFFFHGLWWAFLSGVLLLFSSLGLFVLVLVLVLTHFMRFKNFLRTLFAAIIFSGGFFVSHALVQYFTFQISRFFAVSWVHFLFALMVVLLIGFCCFFLLGLFYDHAHEQNIRVDDLSAQEKLLLLVFGSVAAWFMLSQKNALLLSFAKQSILSELSGSGAPLAGMLSLGSSCVVLLYWLVAAYFLKNEQINLWFSDVVSFFAWLALYFLIQVINPFIFMWHAALLTVALLLFSGVYFWMSARNEMTYQYLQEYAKNSESQSINHQLRGFRLFTARVLAKRIVAVTAFVLIVPFLGKTYLHYHRLTMRQAVLQAIKSL